MQGVIEFHDWKSWKWWYDWSMNTKLDILTCTANSWSWRWHGYACIYIYMTKCQNKTWLIKHQVLKRAYPHTQVQQSATTYWSRKRIIKREKWNFFTLAEQYMIYPHPSTSNLEWFESPNSALLLTHLTRSLKLSRGKWYHMHLQCCYNLLHIVPSFYTQE